MNLQQLVFAATVLASLQAWSQAESLRDYPYVPPGQEDSLPNSVLVNFGIDNGQSRSYGADVNVTLPWRNLQLAASSEQYRTRFDDSVYFNNYNGVGINSDPLASWGWDTWVARSNITDEFVQDELSLGVSFWPGDWEFSARGHRQKFSFKNEVTPSLPTSPYTTSARGMELGLGYYGFENVKLRLNVRRFNYADDLSLLRGALLLLILPANVEANGAVLPLQEAAIYGGYVFGMYEFYLQLARSQSVVDDEQTLSQELGFNSVLQDTWLLQVSVGASKLRAEHPSESYRWLRTSFGFTF